MNYKYITKDLVENLIKTDIDVMAWTVNTKEDIENIKNISKEIYIVTDYPQNIF
jgi:hypothetical protein